VADHALWAIGVVATFFRIRIIPAADAPAFLAGCIIAAVAVTAATPINLAALILNASLTITALRILTAALGFITPFAKAGFWVAGHILRAGIVAPTCDRLIFHRNTDSIIIIHPLAFGTFWAIAIVLAWNDAKPPLRRINAD
jgi:hypothetical protein